MIFCSPTTAAYRNGWLICTASKSFAVYATTATEKSEWMAHINKCVEDLLRKSKSCPLIPGTGFPLTAKQVSQSSGVTLPNIVIFAHCRSWPQDDIPSKNLSGFFSNL